MRMRMLVVLAAALLLGADVKDDIKKDKQALQGDWTLVSMERGGKTLDLTAEENVPKKITIKDDVILATLKDNTEHKANFKIDPSQKPKSIDVTPEDNKDHTMLGVYSVDGDMLKICIDEPNAGRPKELSTKEGSETVLVVFKRDKK
jgi:uncharacterized protein (TIGR03067 family)